MPKFDAAALCTQVALSAAFPEAPSRSHIQAGLPCTCGRVHDLKKHKPMPLLY